MDSSAARRVALMTIHPGYAEAILSGRKRAEFRKRRIAGDIDTVLVYATAPVSAIIGWFTVRDVIKSTPEDIWRRLGEVGEIQSPDFAAYYSGCHEAVALLVGETGWLPKPVPLSDIRPSPAAPQSFSYISDNVLAQIAMTPHIHEAPNPSRYITWIPTPVTHAHSCAVAPALTS